MRPLAILTLSLGLTLAGSTARAQEPEARARIIDSRGRAVGEAQLTQTPNGVLVKAELTGLPPGEHGFHFHEHGACEPPFVSAGEHFNPEGRAHGFEREQGPHAGDLPNIHVPESGNVTVEVLAEDLQLTQGPNALLANDGSALIIHAAGDDYRTSPSGQSGARMACGIVKPRGAAATR